MLAAAALLALATTSPEPRPGVVAVRARAVAAVTILVAAEVRNGKTGQHHQRREGATPDGFSLTLIEFE
jgi:hypothetical protein